MPKYLFLKEHLKLPFVFRCLLNNNRGLPKAFLSFNHFICTSFAHIKVYLQCGPGFLDAKMHDRTYYIFYLGKNNFDLRRVMTNLTQS